MPAYKEQDLTGEVVGPFSSESRLQFACESGGGKPTPTVAWRFGGEDLEGETVIDEDTEVVTSTVVVELVNHTVSAELECL